MFPNKSDDVTKHSEFFTLTKILKKTKNRRKKRELLSQMVDKEL